jgi:hypothetical protein
MSRVLSKILKSLKLLHVNPVSDAHKLAQISWHVRQRTNVFLIQQIEWLRKRERERERVRKSEKERERERVRKSEKERERERETE